MTAGFRKGYADTRLGQLHYVAAGDGPPLVLLPGAGQSHAIFRRLMAALAPFHRIIAIDAFPTVDGANGVKIRKAELRERAAVLLAATDAP